MIASCMRFSQRFLEKIKIARRPFRLIILSLFLLASLFQSVEHVSAPLVALFLHTVYLAFLWTPPRWLQPTRRHIVVIILVWAATALSSIVIDESYLIFFLGYFLIGHIALRFSGSLRIGLAAAVMAANAAYWQISGQLAPNGILTYSLVHVVMYILIISIQQRWESKQAQQRHFRELGQMHAQLESAHQDLQQMHKELEEATVRSLRFAVLEERTRIARDIHDTIGHGLTSVIVQLQALPYMIKANESEADQALATVLNVARNCLTEVRSVVHQMGRDDAGLGLIALKSLIRTVKEQSRLQIRFATEGTITQWHPEIAEALYRILQEALTNIIRHANASEVEVSITESEGKLVMTVADNGPFRSDSPPQPGFGIMSMMARCERIGGSFELRNHQPHGLRMTIRIPLVNPLQEGEKIES
ncbi:sensor histidine kinase [Paenibacillus oryzisoli]|uniref:sensor histidine kinase n=1 Tax=Paenibacillus oryzisoli TaxID=1850517 RepID=UPI003D289A90